jgi:hypothetical protein
MKLNKFFNKEGFDISVVNLEDKHFKEARDYDTKINELDLMKTANYTNCSIPDRYYKGYLGELAFHLYLIKHNIDHVWNTNTLGVSDNGDFIINGKSFDIKTTGVSHYENFLVSTAQMKHYRDYYVFAKIVDTKVLFFGLLTNSEVNKLPIHEFAENNTCYYGDFKAL